MSMWRKITAGALVAAMALSMAACGGDKPAEQDPAQGDAPAANGEKTKITYALWDEIQYPVFEEIVAKFEAENPDIDVDVQLTPWSQYWTKLDAALGGGQAADVFWMNVYLPKYADAGVIDALDSYIEADGVDMNGYVSAITELYNYDGKQYGMPKGMDTVQVFFNEAIFTKYGVEAPKAGWTWEDLVKTGEQLRDAIAAQGGGEYPLAMELDHQPSYFNFIHQEGAEVVTPDQTGSEYDSAAAIKSYQDVVDLMDSKVMPSFQVLSDTKGTDLFLSQKAAMLFMGTWKASVIDEASFGENIGVVPMPKKGANNDSVLAGLCYVVNSDCENKDAAWRLVKYLSGEESNKMQAEAKIDMPALISAQQYYTPNFKHLDASLFFEIAETAFPFPTHPTLPEWYGTVGELSSKIYAGELTAEEGCKQMDEAVEGFLKQ